MTVWKIEPTSIKDGNLPRNAIYYLKELERHRNNNKPRQYNKTLKLLKKAYPEYAQKIDDLKMIKNTKPKGQESWLGVFDISAGDK